MFNFEEFKDYVQMFLNDVLSDEYKNAIVSVDEVFKSNGTILHGVTVRPEGSNIAPIIYVYLEGFFQKYEEGDDLDLVMKEIGTVVMKNMKVPDKFKSIGNDFQNFDFMKDKIIMVAVNAEKNKALLDSAPHVMKEDLALIYKVMLDSGHDGMATITIKNEHMAMWGVTAETIHELAMQNTPRLLPIKVQPMNEVLNEMLGIDGMPDEIADIMFEETPVNQQMYIVSNTSRVNGAASIFYEDALSELAEKMGTDLFILPSSIHECIAVSTDMGTPKDLANLVEDVNSNQVVAEEQLSDHVYRYDAKNKTISIADVVLAEKDEYTLDIEADIEL